MSSEEEKRESAPAEAIPDLIDDDPPPDGGYGWVCCFAMCCLNAGVWGILATYGVYLSYYISHDTFEGTTDIAYSFIGGINFAAAMLVAPFVNALVKRFGTNNVMYVGNAVWLAGWIGASYATTYVALFFTQGLLVGIAGGLIWLPAAPVVAQWFSKKRSLAQGIASAGSGIGGVVFSVATTPMIENLSLGWSLRLTGISSCVMLTGASILIRDRNASIRPGIHPCDVRLMRRKGVVLLIGYTFFVILAYIVSVFSLSAFAISIGLTQRQGGNVIAVLNVGTAIGRPLIGVVSDRYGRVTSAFAITASNVILNLAWWVNIDSFASLLAYGLVTGATSGAYWTTIAPLCAEVVPLADLPSTLALMWLSVSMPSLFSEAIALEIRDESSSRPFLWTQVYSGLTFLVASLFLLELRRMKYGFWGKERHK